LTTSKIRTFYIEKSSEIDDFSGFLENQNDKDVGEIILILFRNYGIQLAKAFQTVTKLYQLMTTRPGEGKFAHGQE